MFEEWVPGDQGKGANSSGRALKGQDYHPANPSGAADGGLKFGGLVKKVCHGVRHWCAVPTDDVIRQSRFK